MRRLLLILFLLLPLIIVAQAPILRNSFTTNQAPPVIGTNIGISNTASSFMWKFYGGSDPNRVAVLSDIVGGTATNAIGNLNGYGTNTTFFGPLVWGSTNVMEEISAMIRRSNGFGTNLTLLGDRFSMSTTGLVYTNFAGVFPRVGISTNKPQAILHINIENPLMCSLLVASNGWSNGFYLTPSLIITNGRVGIGRHDPRREFEVRGNTAVSGSGTYSNGLGIEGGFICISGLTNWGPANFSNTLAGQYHTAIAVNTNAPTGIAVVQIAGGILGPGITATNQYVLLYTNPIYGKGFAVETNGAVTASSFTGITPGGGAFIADLNGNGTNTTLYGVGSSNIAYWTDKEWTLTNTGYGTRMRWQAPLGTLKTDGGLGVGGGATIGDGMLITNNVVVFGAVYAQGFTNTSAGAYFTDLTASKVAVFGPGSYLTNSTIDAADLSKLGATNFDSLFVTNTLVASNIVATNFTVDTFTSSTLQLSNALEVPFGGTGTNTNVLGSFFIGNGTNPVVFLDTNTYANWLSNQIVTTGISGGTNFPGIFVTNNAEMFGLIVRSNTGFPAASLLKGNLTLGHMGIWNSNGTAHFGFATNNSDYYIPLSMDFGHAEFNKMLYVRQGMEMSNGLTYWQMWPTNRFFFRQIPAGGLYIRPQVATNDGAGGYGGLMDMALRTDVTNYPVINGPTFVGGSTNAGILVVSNSGGTFAVVVTNSATAKGTYIGTNGNISTSGNISTAAGTVSGDTVSGGAVSSSSYVMAALNNIFRWGSGTGPSLSSGSQTNSIRLLDSFASGNQISAAVSNGSSLLLPPSYSLPNVGANCLTSSVFGAVWSIGNTNGTLAFATSTNGTNLYIVAGLNPTNGLWVSNDVTVLGTNYATAFVGDGSLLTGLSSSGTNFNGIYVTNNSVALSNVFTGGRTHPTNGLLFPTLSASPYTTNDLFTVGSGATSNGLWAIYNSNSVLFIETSPGAAAKKTIVLSSNGNITVPGQLTIGGSSAASPVLASSAQLSADGFVSIASGSRTYSPTNGTIRFGDKDLSRTAVGTNGATILLDPVAILPFAGAGATMAVLTNKQIAIANTNGELRIFMATNGTSLTDSTARKSIDVFGINASNIWVQTQQMTNNSASSLGGQPIACYAAMMFNSTNYGQRFGASYTNITGFNIWNTNWFVVNTNTGYATNIFAGYYRCTINISMIGQNAGIYEGCLRTNDIDPETIGFKHQHDNPARLRSASGVGVIYLPANTGCSFSLKSDVPGLVDFHRGSMTIGTP